jgi:hypothetical protein
MEREMSKQRRDEEDDEARQEKILDQLKEYGRLPTPPPGIFHESDKQRRKRVRKDERNRLRSLAQTVNSGEEIDDDE